MPSDQVSSTAGWSVGTAGDVNADGYADVVVGAPAHDNGEVDEGQVGVDDECCQRPHSPRPHSGFLKQYVTKLQ